MNIKAFLEEAFTTEYLPTDWHGTPTGEPEKSYEFPHIDFNKIVPQPENIETDGCTGKHEPGVVCWYDWNTTNWGTKWGAYSHSHYEVTDDGGRVNLVFDTAWSQPTPIFDAIQERWGLTVHAVTQDEGGSEDVEYGDPYGEDLIYRTVSYEFT